MSYARVRHNILFHICGPAILKFAFQANLEFLLPYARQKWCVFALALHS